MAETANLTTLEYGDPDDYRRALVIQGDQIDGFTRIPQAHPSLVLVVLHKTPNDAVYETSGEESRTYNSDRHVDAEPILDGGFRGWLCAQIPFEELRAEEHAPHLYEALGLRGDELTHFLEAYNTWVQKSRSTTLTTTPTAS